MNQAFFIVKVIGVRKKPNKVAIGIKISEKQLLKAEMILSQSAINSLRQFKKQECGRSILVKGALSTRRNLHRMDEILIFADECIPSA